MSNTFLAGFLPTAAVGRCVRVSAKFGGAAPAHAAVRFEIKWEFMSYLWSADRLNIIIIIFAGNYINFRLDFMVFVQEGYVRVDYGKLINEMFYLSTFVQYFFFFGFLSISGGLQSALHILSLSISRQIKQIFDAGYACPLLKVGEPRQFIFLFQDRQISMTSCPIDNFSPITLQRKPHIKSVLFLS